MVSQTDLMVFGTSGADLVPEDAEELVFVHGAGSGPSLHQTHCHCLHTQLDIDTVAEKEQSNWKKTYPGRDKIEPILGGHTQVQNFSSLRNTYNITVSMCDSITGIDHSHPLASLANTPMPIKYTHINFASRLTRRLQT